MFLKVTRVKGHRYLRIAEAYRDPKTGKPQQRYLANLGRADRLETANIDSLINGLLRETDRPALHEITAGLRSETTRFAPALQLGDVWTLLQLWQQLGFAKTVARALRRRGYQRVDFEQLVRVMVINRLSDPTSKLGLLRWLETVHLPGINRKAVTHQNLLRAMDALIEHKEALEAQLLGQLLPLFDDEMEVVFYDLTTVGVEGESEMREELRHYGHSKDTGHTARQFVVGVVQTAEGLPVLHEVFEGNIGEARTLQGIVERLRQRFPIRRLVLVADRGLLTEANLEALEAMNETEEGRLEYIVAVPARRHLRLTEALARLHPKLVKVARRSGEEAITETAVEDDTGRRRRLVIAHSESLAARSRTRRREQLRALSALASELEGKLQAQDAGEPHRGRRLTDAGAKLKLARAVADERLSALIRVDENSPLFCWSWRMQAFRTAWQRDGKLVLITNIAKSDMRAETVVERYKALADIERGFRVLKSEIEIAPVYHRLPDRIRAHTFLCFLALVIHRVMRLRLKAKHTDLSPARLLERLKQVQYHRARLATGQQLEGVSALAPEQRELFKALEVPAPTQKALADAA